MCRLESLPTLSGEGARKVAVCPRHTYGSLAPPVLGIETWCWSDTWRNLHMDRVLDSGEASLLSLSSVMMSWWLHRVSSSEKQPEGFLGEMTWWLGLTFVHLFLAALGLGCCTQAFSNRGQQRLLSCCGARAPHGSGLSCCRTWSLERGLSSCEAQAKLSCGIWDLPRSGIEHVFPALQGGLLTTGAQGKPLGFIFSVLQSPHTIHNQEAAAAAKSLQSCPTLCNPRDGSPPGSPVPGILQARTLEWVAISFSRSSQPRDRTLVFYISCIGRGILYH